MTRVSLLAFVSLTFVLTVVNRCDAQPPVAFHFAVEPATATIDYDVATGAAQFEVLVTVLQFGGAPVSTTGMSMGLRHPAGLLNVTNVEVDGVLATIDGGGPLFGPDFVQINLYADGFTTGVVYSLSGGVFFVYSQPGIVFRAVYETDAAALVGDLDGEEASLEWANDLGMPPVENLVVGVAGPLSILFQPSVFNSTIVLSPVALSFLRGDSNRDLSFDLADAVATLTALFVFGTPPLACERAADTNDNGTVDVADAVYSLSALFVPGAPLPPAPFPNCGADPTPDALTCEMATVCP
ncbi:MAG: hypothetical protein ACKVX7_20110 [Planctomycetota bacterium]